MVHVGPSVEGLGGIESVIRAYVTQQWSALDMHAVASWRGTEGDGGKQPVRTFLEAMSQLRKIIQTNTDTVIHIHVSHLGSFIREGALAFFFRRKNRVVLTVHGSAFVSTSNSLPWRLIYRAVLSRASAVCVLNEGAYKRVVQLAPQQTVKLATNPPPTPPAMVPTPVEKTERIVIFAGSVGRRKGVDTLLDAWAEVTKQVPDAQLHLYGPLERDFHVSGKNVVSKGRVTELHVCEALGKSRVAVLPSRAEAMPIFVIEALQAGRPTIVSAVGAMPEQIGKGGVVVQPEDSSTLAASIIHYLCDPGAAAADGQLARRMYDEKYSRTRLESELLETYGLVQR
ncbi:glycosyltransferase family 4 protein [Microbacterium sp. NPDC086615]|uniref:glycosyltransferase family 4 protein n=1 Tax=Microbacterium sp. NPDC086615 TaxID=3154865 RepID=UPI003447AF5F